MVYWKILAGAIILLTCGAVFAFARGKVEGNGKVTAEEHIVPVFERLQAAGKADVRIHQSEESRVVISADSNLHGFIKIKHDGGGGLLEIRPEGREESFPRYTVDVYCAALKGLSLIGEVSAVFDAPIAAQTFEVSMIGDGSAALRGQADDFTINLVGNGAVDGKDLKARTVKANLVGEGCLSVWTEALTVNITGNARVSYRGDPVLEIAGVGNSRIARIAD